MQIDKEMLPKVLLRSYRKYSELEQVNKGFESNNLNDELLSSQPYRVFIEPTNDCFMNCYYCARDLSKRDIGYMKLGDYKKIIDGIEPYTQLILVGNGEPMMNKDIFKMIDYGAKKNMFVSIITNGGLLTESNSKKLANSGIHRVQISFDSIDKEIYEKSTGHTVTFERVLYNLLRFIKIVRESRANIFLTISAVLTKEVEEKIQGMREFWNKLPIDNLYEGPLLSLQVESNAYDEIDFNAKHEYAPCANPWTIAKINYNGDVNICPQDFASKHVVGNIESSMDVINSQKAKDLRKAILTKDINFFETTGYNCHKCNAWHKEHNIQDYMTKNLPTVTGLTMFETALHREYPREQMDYLEYLLNNYSDISNILREFQ